MYTYIKIFLIPILLAIVYTNYNVDINRLVKSNLTNIDNRIYNNEDFNWWDKNYINVHGLHQMNQFRVDYILDRLPTIKNNNSAMIADIGCGGGILTESIAKANPINQIYAIDISPNSIKQAITHANRNTIKNINYSVGSAYDTRLDSNTYDIVIMSDVLEHLHDLPSAIKEIKRILKPRGIFIFDTFNRSFMSWFFSIFIAQDLIGLLPKHTHEWELFIKPRELNTLFNKYELKLIEISGFSTDISVLDVLKFIITKSIPKLYFKHTDNTNIQYFGYAIKTNNT
jgi:2-polyprenyl-6-hydroxyphenyl methylase / 3-demethylubiquinone-9 3-methyltransferase